MRLVTQFLGRSPNRAKNSASSVWAESTMPVPNVRSLLLVNCNLKCIQPTVITYGVTVHVCCFISSDAVIAESVEFFMGDNLPHLGAGDVVDEVVALLAKLECERCEVLDALQRERQRSEVLKVRINEFCKKRLVDLPKAVQAGQCCVSITRFVFQSFSFLSLNALCSCFRTRVVRVRLVRTQLARRLQHEEVRHHPPAGQQSGSAEPEVEGRHRVYKWTCVSSCLTFTSSKTVGFIAN